MVKRQEQEIWGDREKLMISIGTGKGSITSVGGKCIKIGRALADIVTQTERINADFDQENQAMVKAGLFFRFNVTHGLDGVGLQEHHRVDLIASATKLYLKNPENVRKLAACAGKLSGNRSTGNNPLSALLIKLTIGLDSLLVLIVLHRPFRALQCIALLGEREIYDLITTTHDCYSSSL